MDVFERKVPAITPYPDRQIRYLLGDGDVDLVRVYVDSRAVKVGKQHA